MSALTVVILTKDEEAMIGRAIASVSFAGEVVVCDGGSSDTTIDIARRAGARVIERPFDDFARQRNFALSEATGEWILFVDADERATPELASELRALLEAGPERDSYRVPRRSMVLGRWIDWHYEGPDAPVRLVRAGSGTWVSRVHERFEGAGEPGMLSGTLLHLTHRSISDVMRKIEAYSTLEAEELASLGARPPRARALLAAFPKELWRLWRSGLRREGTEGAVEAVLLAFYRTLVVAKVWERTRDESLAQTYERADREIAREVPVR